MSDPQIALLGLVQKWRARAQLRANDPTEPYDATVMLWFCAKELEALLLRSQGVIRQECSPEENARIEAAIDRDAAILNTGFDIGLQMGREETKAKEHDHARVDSAIPSAWVATAKTGEGIREKALRGFLDVMHTMDESTGCDKLEGRTPDGHRCDFWCSWNPQAGPACEACANLQRMIMGAFGTALGLSVEDAYHNLQPPASDGERQA